MNERDRDVLDMPKRQRCIRYAICPQCFIQRDRVRVSRVSWYCLFAMKYRPQSWGKLYLLFSMVFFHDSCFYNQGSVPEEKILG